ncbi:ROK family transcriptional regulator [Microbacter sp. GSS18]|nr:ROK family transcriptional regulator [Microbacter sp. GSS18]
MSLSGADLAGGRGGDVEVAALSTILMHGPVSRTDLAARLSLSPSTMTRAVKPLLDRGLVHETADAVEGPGRPSRPLVGTRGSGRYVGAKLTGDEVFAVATDMMANVISVERRELASHQPDAVADAVADVVRHLGAGDGLDGIGVSLGGSAMDGRTVDRAPFLGWREVPLAEMLETRVEAPVVIDNDLAALTAAEHWFGLGRGLSDFAVVTIGAGTGLGLVHHDEVVRTRDLGLGPAGHIPLEPFGPRCALGHRGCAEAVVTVPAMETQARVALQRDVRFEEVLDLARSGDPACADIVRTAARATGRLIALVANLAMVEVVVLGGEGLALLDVAEPDMRAQIAIDRDPEAHDLDIRIDRSGFPLWARGAATIAIQSSLRRLIQAPASP